MNRGLESVDDEIKKGFRIGHHFYARKELEEDEDVSAHADRSRTI